MPIAKRRTLVLAFDIERSGGREEHDTIGIGASVVDENLEELDSLFLPGYFPCKTKAWGNAPGMASDETKFEQRCWDEFWVNHQDKLSILEYKGDKTKTEREKEMIEQFQAFRDKWQDLVEQWGDRLELVADNNVYDGGFINNLINKYTESLPIPYNSYQEYKPFWETHSEQRGLLMAVDPDFKQNGGYTKRIAELYDLPPQKKDVSHDHNPANDAYTIACEQQVLLGIRDGRIKRRPTSVCPVRQWGNPWVLGVGLLSFVGSVYTGYRRRS